MDPCLKAMEKDSQSGSSISRETLKKFKKDNFSDHQIREMNEVLHKLDLPALDQFAL
jgi:hypothetical protein